LPDRWCGHGRDHGAHLGNVCFVAELADKAGLGTVDVQPWGDGTGVTLRLANAGCDVDLGPSHTSIRAVDSATRRRVQALISTQLSSL